MREHSNNYFSNALMSLAGALAIMAAFLATPPIYGYTVNFVCHHMATHLGPEYGPSLEPVVKVCWGVIVAVCAYNVAKATLGAALVIGGLGLLMRLMT